MYTCREYVISPHFSGSQMSKQQPSRWDKGGSVMPIPQVLLPHLKACTHRTAHSARASMPNNDGKGIVPRILCTDFWILKTKLHAPSGLTCTLPHHETKTSFISSPCNAICNQKTRNHFLSSREVTNRRIPSSPKVRSTLPQPGRLYYSNCLANTPVYL